MDEHSTREELIEENKRLQNSLAALRRKHMAFEKAMSVLQDGFVVIDNAGRIIEINEACCRYFEVKKEEVFGKHIYRLIHNAKLPDVVANKLTEIDVIHTFVDGQKSSGERMVAVSRIAVMDGDEAVAGAALIKFSGHTNKIVQALYEMGQELDYYRKELIRHSIYQFSFETLPTANGAFREAKLQAERFANCDLPILLRGETGVGKEVFANAIHLASDRRRGPFVCVNCTSIPAELLEAELFGYEDGAFTGGKRGGRRGKFELANKGTLFLDEVGDMPAPMQVKLLRVLQDNCIEKVGSESPLRVDVRIVTATNQDLEAKIEAKSFREDLYYRLNVLPVHIPALRERREDIPVLAHTFLDELNQRYSQRLALAPEVLIHLQSYDWPGNIRELKNVLGRMFMLTYVGDTILPEYIPPNILAATRHVDQQQFIASSDMGERERILLILDKFNYNCAKTAKFLGIHRTTLYNKLKRFGILIERLRDDSEETAESA